LSVRIFTKADPQLPLPITPIFIEVEGVELVFKISIFSPQTTLPSSQL